MRKLLIRGIEISISQRNHISNTEFLEAYSKMRDAFSLTVPEFRRLLSCFGIHFNWMNDLTCFPPIALGDIIKFTKSNRDKFVSYDKNGKITLGNVNEPGFYRVLSIRKREPTFNDVLVRREDYDMFSGMSCAETVRVSKKLGLSYCTAGDSTWLAWKSGFGFICLGILDASKLGFTSFRMIVPSEIQCIFTGFEGRDVNDHHYNLVDAVKEEFLRPLLRNAEQSRDLRLSGYIPLLSDVKIEELPEQLREVLCGTINVRLMKGA